MIHSRPLGGAFSLYIYNARDSHGRIAVPTRQFIGFRESEAFSPQYPCQDFCIVTESPYLYGTQSANLSERFHIMAKARVSTNPMYTGGAGGYSFYVRGGEQVVRQRRNNSNYGETASRSEAQMIRRVRWANLVNMYKACKFWMPKAFETKSKGQTDYNLFMSMNINEARVALTKDMAQNGCAVNAGQYVSRGSIAPIALYEYDTGVGAELEIAMTITPGASTTVGQFSADIIANNPVFKEGDNIGVVMFVNTQDGRNYPYLQTTYSEVTLNSSSTQLLQTISLMNRISKSNGGRLKFAVGASQSHESGIAFIHTRKIGGELQVSTQRVFQTGENINGEYDSDSWTQECINSYGLDVEVPLDPSFRPGTITSVTANSVEVSDGDTLNGQQTIRVYGTNLYGTNFKFLANGVQYTPLEVNENYIQFSITANCDVILMLNENRYLSFDVTGIVTPSDLTGRVVAGLAANSGGTSVPAGSLETQEGCLNFPKMVTEAFPYIRVFVYGDSLEETDFSPVGCTIDRSTAIDGGIVLALRPTSATSVCYVTYEGYIFFVGNYTL